MIFPDPNIGYLFDYESSLTDHSILVTFLSRWVKIHFKLDDIDQARIETYRGGRISWNVIRWGKCPPGTTALRVHLKAGAFREHLIVFDDLAAVVAALKRMGVAVSEE
jgi:hypothetical protein